MKKAFVITVGTGTRPDVNIARPLTKAVKRSGASLVVFIASEKSKATAERIARDAGLAEEEREIVPCGDQDDLEAVFREVAALLERLSARGFEPGSIELDFTSGTKAMTGGAVLAAMDAGIGTLEYITGERVSGVVKDGTERFVAFEPAKVRAARDLARADALIRALRFEAAIDLLESTPQGALESSSDARLKGLLGVARAFRAWDLFDHDGFEKAYGRIDLKAAWARPYRLSEDSRNRLRALAGAGQSIGPDRIADLANNAARRLYEGKWDDAVARSYRLCEMLAQSVLAGLGHDPGSLDVARLPPRSREWLRPPEPGERLALGLRGIYRLLGDLEQPLGRRFSEARPLDGLLNERNGSILAHGAKPMTERIATKLFKEVVALVETEIPDFAARREALRFPWQAPSNGGAPGS